MSISAPSILYDTLLGADNGFLYLFHLAVCTRAIDLNPHGINTVSALDLLDNHVYAGGSRGTVLILNPMNNFEVLFVISTLPSQPAAQPTSIIGSTPSPRPGTPSSTKSQGNPQSRPRSSSATRARPSPSNQPQAAGGKSSQVQPTISRKARAKVPSSGWTGPGNRTDESLPAGVKASTDVKGIVLLPVISSIFFF